MQVFFKFFLLFSILLLKNSVITAQSVYFSDIFKGGITGDGFVSSASADTCVLSVNLNSANSVRRAFLFCEYRNKLLSKDINFNGTNLLIDEIYSLNNQISININGVFDATILSLALDVTNLIDVNQNNYYIVPPLNQSPVAGDDLLSGYYLLILFDNITMPMLGVQIMQNNQNANQQYNFTVSNLNSADLNFPIALSLRTNDICNNNTDGSIVELNGNLLGIIGGS